MLRPLPVDTMPEDSLPADAGLAGIVQDLIARHAGLNGFNLLKTGGEALAARLAIIQSTRSMLDLQYYMLQDDLTGKLIIEELLRAADRGVRVRVLLDDLDFGRAKESVCILDAHENIEFRIFNPASTRKQRLLFRVSRWSRTMERYTKRMHNKALIADGQLGVVGGRNLGDEYFDVAEEFAFSDLDVLVMGPVLQGINDCFECYWNSRAAHDLKSLGYEMPSARSYHVHRIALNRYYEDVAKLRVVSKAKPQDYLNGLQDGSLPLIWAEAEFTMDDPDKIFKPVEQAKSPPMNKLLALLQQAQHEFVAVSPYLIPAKEGMRILDALHGRGVKMRMLTNSLASTDISAVHAAYSRYRPAMLKDGIALYELKPIPGKRTRSNLFRKKASSRSSLHAKLYVIDGEYVVIGSMNLDPRSWRRNTETVITLRSKDMAALVLEMFDDITDAHTSYRVDMQQGKLRWQGEEKGQPVTYCRDPKPGLFRRFWTWVFYYTAPESQL